VPDAAPKACPAPGCNLARPCPDHPARWAEGQPGRRYRPGDDALRASVLARDPACRLALPGCDGASREVHHVTPGQDASAVGACRRCHAAVTAAQATAARLAAKP
jgi:hypothetical protein